MFILNEEIKEQERQAIREIKSYLTTELIKLDASRSSTLTGIDLMKTTPL